MRYMLLIYSEESQWSSGTEAEQQAELQRWYEYGTAMREAGVSEIGEPLQPVATATCVRDDGGEPLVTDGPFAETKEQLGGFYLLECANLDEALGWAKKIPARAGAVEVRPVQDFSDEGAPQ